MKARQTVLRLRPGLDPNQLRCPPRSAGIEMPRSLTRLPAGTYVRIMAGLTWRPINHNQFHGYDDEGQLRGWVWRVQDDDWLATRASDLSETVLGRRPTPEAAMSLVDDRVG